MRATRCSSTCAASGSGADQQPEPRARALRPDRRRTCATRSSPSRTGASTRTRRRHPRHRARVRPGHRQRSAVQGGSTITQQFVKNALRAQGDRTVFEKLREAALAYHLDAQVVEGARSSPSTSTRSTSATAPTASSPPPATYFGKQPDHIGCGTDGHAVRDATQPEEAALIAGVVANPSAYDPVAHPAGRRARGATSSCAKCSSRARSRALEYFNARQEALPAAADIQPPTVDTKAPYFTTWVRQQLVDRFGARRAFEGGLTRPHDARPRPADGRREGDQPLPGQPGRADRRARGDRQRDRRGAGDGRRPRLRQAAVQPRHPGPAPAGLGVQAVHPGRRRCARGSARRRCGRRASATSSSRTRTGASTSSSTTSRATTRACRRWPAA